MKNASVRNVFRCLFAAWLLLATSITSSTFVHRHNGGDRSHQHEDSHGAVAHSASHDHGHSHGDRDSRTDGLSSSAADFHRHGCLPLLGAFAYQPLSGEKSDPRETWPLSWEGFVAVATIPSVCPTSQNVTMNPGWLASLAKPAIGGANAAQGREFFSGGVVLAFPLCDRARHERSGVLLS